MRSGTIARNTLAQVIGKMVNAGAMFLASILIARSFGAGGYGDFTKITTYVAFYYLLADFGLNAIYLQKQTKKEYAWDTLIGLRVVLSLCLMFLALAILSLLPAGTNQGYTAMVRLGIILFSPAIFFQALVTTTNALFQKYLRYGLATVALTAGSFSTLFLVWVATNVIAVPFGALFASLAILGGAVVTALVALGFTRGLAEPLSVSFALNPMRNLFLASVPLGLTLLFDQVYFRLDSFVLTLTRSTAEVGIYGLAYKVFEIPLVVPTFFMNTMYPILLATKDQGSRTFLWFIKKSFWLLVTVSLVTVSVLWFAAPLLALIRPEFSQSVAALRILILGLPLFFVTSLLMWLVIVLEKQNVLPFVYGASMVFTIFLDVLLIPRYGYISAAWITVVSEAVVLILLGFILTRIFSKSSVLQ